MMDIYSLFERFTQENSFRFVERSNLVSKYFKGEFNLSGGHSYLVPAILNPEKVRKDSISVIDLCVRKVDAQIVGVSYEHLLLFEMGVWGGFGFIEDKKAEEYKHLSLLIEFLELCGISRDEIYVTACEGGVFLGQEIPVDTDSVEIFKAIGIKDNHVILTKGRRNFMLSRGIDRLAGYNVEFFVKRNNRFIEIASSNIYQYINKLSYLEKTVNTGIGCGVGLERIEFVTNNMESAFELPFYSNSIKEIRKLMNLSKDSSDIIIDKLVRIIELSKTLIFLLNDDQTFDNTPQGKIMKSYFAKVISEMEFLAIPNEPLLNIIREEMKRKYYRYQIKDDAFEFFGNRIIDLQKQAHVR